MKGKKEIVNDIGSKRKIAINFDVNTQDQLDQSTFTATLVMKQVVKQS